MLIFLKLQLNEMTKMYIKYFKHLINLEGKGVGIQSP